MSTYDVLRRVKKNELREEQVAKAELERELEALEAHQRALEEELAEQSRLVTTEEVYRITYGDFLWRYRTRREESEGRKALIVRNLEHVTARIHRKFGELKKMEILAERERERARVEYESKVQKERDELTIVGVARRVSGIG